MTIYDHVKLQWITAFAELDKIRSLDDATPPDEDADNQNSDSSKKTAVQSAPRPPFIRNKTRSANALLSPASASPPTPKDLRLPELPSARRGQSEGESSGNNDSWAAGVSDDGQASRDRLFERSPTKTRLEQVLENKQVRPDGDLSSEASKTRPPRLALPELSPQQVLLPIPSIYLNPDLTHAHEAERAARRRLRHNAKLAQRLRRITF
jgi:hypothetical protein